MKRTNRDENRIANGIDRNRKKRMKIKNKCGRKRIESKNKGKIDVFSRIRKRKMTKMKWERGEKSEWGRIGK